MRARGEKTQYDVHLFVWLLSATYFCLLNTLASNALGMFSEATQSLFRTLCCYAFRLLVSRGKKTS